MSYEWNTHIDGKCTCTEETVEGREIISKLKKEIKIQCSDNIYDMNLLYSLDREIFYTTV